MDGDKQPLIQPAYPPPPQAQYPPPQAPPPPYGYQGAPVQQQQNNIVVVTSQPTPVVYTRHYGSGDHFLLLSIILSIVCLLCGTWWALFCTVPAIFYAIHAQEAEARGDHVAMETNHRIALYLNIGACVTYAVTFTCLIITIIAVDV